MKNQQIVHVNGAGMDGDCDVSANLGFGKKKVSFGEGRHRGSNANWKGRCRGSNASTTSSNSTEGG